MEPYLQKCFPGIKGLCMAQEGGLRAEALISPEGETLPLVTSVDLQVWVWWADDRHALVLPQELRQLAIVRLRNEVHANLAAAAMWCPCT